MNIRKEINPELDCDPSPISHVDGLPDLACGWVIREYRPAGRLIKLIVPHRPDILLDSQCEHPHGRHDDRMPYWAYLWPAAIQMASVVSMMNLTPGTRVLEIGCGLGLVGIAALANGCRVSLTDYDSRSVAVAAVNAQLNGFNNYEAFELDWRTTLDQQYSMVLGCDLVYERKNHAPILNFLDTTLTPDGICWLGDAGRNAAVDFWSLAQEQGFRVSIFDVNGNQQTTPSDRFQWFELSRSPMSPHSFQRQE